MANDEVGHPDWDPEGQDWLEPDFWDLPRDPRAFLDSVVGWDPALWAEFKTLPVLQGDAKDPRSQGRANAGAAGDRGGRRLVGATALLGCVEDLTPRRCRS